MYRAWEKEIQKDLEDKKRSVMFALGEQNEIEKSLANDIRYDSNGNNDLAFVIKKGEEIKPKLESERSNSAIKLATCNIQATKLKEEIGVEPTKDAWQDDNDMKIYPYELIYPTSKTESNLGEELSVSTSTNVKMREYNDYIDKMYCLKKDIKIYTTLINGLKDDKNYKLPIMVASQLGF